MAFTVMIGGASVPLKAKRAKRCPKCGQPCDAGNERALHMVWTMGEGDRQRTLYRCGCGYREVIEVELPPLGALR